MSRNGFPDGDLMPEFVDWRHAPDAAALVEQALAALHRGEWVGLPTECGYAAGARASSAAVERLPAEGLEWSLAPHALGDWLTALDPVAQRLLRRCWPGPALLEIEQPGSEPLLGRLPPLVWARVYHERALVLRSPGHEAVLAVLDRVGEPLVLAEPTDTAGPTWIASLGDALGMVVEDDAPAFDRPTTRVRIANGVWSIRREGVYSAAELQRLAAFLIVFVCTGNTCRSPMAEALCKKLLADRLGCPQGELIARGWWVLSAGVSAQRGEPATPEAQAAVRSLGADLAEHASRPIGPELVELADRVVAMTRQQAELVREMFPNVQPRLLGGEDELPDPFGSTQADYDECARTIQNHLQRFLAEVLPL